MSGRCRSLRRAPEQLGGLAVQAHGLADGAAHVGRAAAAGRARSGGTGGAGE